MKTRKSHLWIIAFVGALCVLMSGIAEARVKIREKQVTDCVMVCTVKIAELGKKACVSTDDVRFCMANQPECKGITPEASDIITKLCEICGGYFCRSTEPGPRAEPGEEETDSTPNPQPSTSAPAPAPAPTSAPPVTPPTREGVTPADPPTAVQHDQCVAKGGVWVEVEEVTEERRGDVIVRTPGIRRSCFTLEHAYNEIQALKLRVAALEGKPAMTLTDQEVQRLRVIMGMDLSRGFPAEQGWAGEIADISMTFYAICTLPPQEQKKYEADQEQNGQKPSIVRQCIAFNAWVVSIDEKADKAVKTADEAKAVAKQAAEDASIAKQTAYALGGKPSYARISLIGALHLRLTPTHNNVGNDFVAYTGIEGQWMHQIVAGGLYGTVEGGIGYSTNIYGSRSGVGWLGIGLGGVLYKDLLGSLFVESSSFYADNEFSKLNTYDLAPEITWSPGLSTIRDGQVRFALTLRGAVGLMRVDVRGVGVVNDWNGRLALGLGILF